MNGGMGKRSNPYAVRPTERVWTDQRDVPAVERNP